VPSRFPIKHTIGQLDKGRRLILSSTPTAAPTACCGDKLQYAEHVKTVVPRATAAETMRSAKTLNNVSGAQSRKQPNSLGGNANHSTGGGRHRVA
jgi:hypothetical protein